MKAFTAVILLLAASAFQAQAQSNEQDSTMIMGSGGRVNPNWQNATNIYPPVYELPAEPSISMECDPDKGCGNKDEMLCATGDVAACEAHCTINPTSPLCSDRGTISMECDTAKGCGNYDEMMCAAGHAEHCP